MHNEVHQTIRHEVADPDGLDFAFTVQLFHRAPGAVVIAEWLVDQVEVEIVELQLLQGLCKGKLGTLAASILNPNLGRNKQLFTGYTATLDCTSDRFFVQITSSGI